MIHNFRYMAPRTIEELHNMLSNYNEQASILAGGTDLLVNIRNETIKPKYLIDIKKIPDLSKITWNDQDGLSIYANTTINELLNSKLIRDVYPIISTSAHDLASHQIRNRATLIGNIANASPCSDMAPALLCLNAQVVITSNNSKRIVSLNNFFKGVKKTVIQSYELIERIIIPPTTAYADGKYLKLKRIKGHDLSLVGVALLKYKNNINIGISSAAPTPILIELNKTDSNEIIINKVMQLISPISDLRCTKEYRVHMIKVFVHRLLQEVK